MVAELSVAQVGSERPQKLFRSPNHKSSKPKNSTWNYMSERTWGLISHSSAMEGNIPISCNVTAKGL
jgi:hypothetical protein